jgi:hypothetical protein
MTERLNKRLINKSICADLYESFQLRCEMNAKNDCYTLSDVCTK